jgi:transcription elongation GreA/GreB family factor
MNQDHRDQLLDLALAATFPASDALSIVQPGPVAARARPEEAPARDAGALQVRVGSTVTYREVGQGMQRTVRLVPRDHDEAAPDHVAIDSPVGRSLIGRDQGEASVIRAPVGVRVPIQILRVTHLE